MPNRHLLLPAPPDERTCDGCDFPSSDHRWCTLHGGKLNDDGRSLLRNARCLTAEQSAREQAAELAKLRRIEDATRAFYAIYEQNPYAPSSPEESEASGKLCAALEEK
jgi:hypothetical protein